MPQTLRNTHQQLTNQLTRDVEKYFAYASHSFPPIPISHLTAPVALLQYVEYFQLSRSLS